MRWVFEPPVVKLINPRWGKCALCGTRKDEMIYIKDLRAIVCREHETYAVVGEIDDVHETRQWVEQVCANAEEACEWRNELGRRLRETRRIAGSPLPQSYFVKPLRALIDQRRRFSELEEDVEESW